MDTKDISGVRVYFAFDSGLEILIGIYTSEEKVVEAIDRYLDEKYGDNEDMKTKAWGRQWIYYSDCEIDKDYKEFLF